MAVGGREVSFSFRCYNQCCIFMTTSREQSSMEHLIASGWREIVNGKINGDENRDNVQRKGGARRGIDRQTAGANGAVSSGDSFSLLLPASPALAPPRQVKRRDPCAIGTSSMERGDEGRDAEWLLPWDNFKISGCRCRKIPCLGRCCSPMSVFV